MTHLLLINCVPLTVAGTQNEARLTAELRSMLNNRTFVMNSATPSLMPMLNGQLEESNVYMRWVSEEGCRIVYHTNSAVSTAIVALLTRKLVANAYAVALRRTGTVPDDFKHNIQVLQVLETGVLPLASPRTGV
jgi:hypothetical protein